MREELLQLLCDRFVMPRFGVDHVQIELRAVVELHQKGIAVADCHKGACVHGVRDQGGDDSPGMEDLRIAVFVAQTIASELDVTNDALEEEIALEA
jgi:hypothetical protein